jgi:hypothetical protein
MTNEQLPDGLELAQNLISRAWHLGACSTESMEFAAKSIDTEHTQRITLQRHAADQAQRIADLGKERDELRARLAELDMTIRALPLPHGPRQVVRLTDAQADKAFDRSMAARPRDASNAETRRLFVSEIETAVLAANGLVTK